MRLLLDINVWVALLDDAHVHNARALELFSRPSLQIATCPLIENGVLRILNLPSYSRSEIRSTPGFDVVREKMSIACKDVDHEFWPDSISLIADDLVDWQRVFGHGQITDLYLLGLATQNQGALATFDHRIALSAIPLASDRNLVLL